MKASWWRCRRGIGMRKWSWSSRPNSLNRWTHTPTIDKLVDETGTLFLLHESRGGLFPGPDLQLFQTCTLFIRFMFLGPMTFYVACQSHTRKKKKKKKKRICSSFFGLSRNYEHPTIHRGREDHVYQLELNEQEAKNILERVLFHVLGVDTKLTKKKSSESRNVYTLEECQSTMNQINQLRMLQPTDNTWANELTWSSHGRVMEAELTVSQSRQ